MAGGASKAAHRGGTFAAARGREALADVWQHEGRELPVAGSG